MKTGPKGRSPEQQRAAGETRPSRAVVNLFPDHASRPDPEVFDPPRWLSKDAKRLWKAKVERYRQRAQKIGGFEDALAQYCALEAELIDHRKRKLVPPMAMVTAHRMWAEAFYDTPASHKVPASGSAKPGNAFARHGQRAAGA